MKACLIKDFLTCKSILKSYLFMIGVFFVISIALENFGIVAGILCIVPLMNLINSLAYDEKSKWEKMALCSTVTRKEIVISKVVYATILTMGATILTCIVYYLIEGNLAGSLFVGGTLGIISITYCLFITPLLFKYGAEKARTFLLGTLLIPIILIMCLWFFGKDLLINITTINIGVLLVISLACLITIWTLLINLSIKIVTKKDY